MNFFTHKINFSHPGYQKLFYSRNSELNSVVIGDGEQGESFINAYAARSLTGFIYCDDILSSLSIFVIPGESSTRRNERAYQRRSDSREIYETYT